MDKPIKLTPKQKEVIKLMREGWVIRTETTDYTDLSWMSNSANGASNGIRYNTFKIIHNNGLIVHERTTAHYQQYILTELGRTI